METQPQMRKSKPGSGWEHRDKHEFSQYQQEFIAQCIQTE